MRIFKAIKHWIRNLFFPVAKQKATNTVNEKLKDGFQFVIVEEIPEVLKLNTIYILNEGCLAEALFFMCPCGCGADIQLNLLKDSSPLWKYSITNDQITISPSIWRKVGCRSHFFIRGGILVWA